MYVKNPKFVMKYLFLIVGLMITGMLSQAEQATAGPTPAPTPAPSATWIPVLLHAAHVTLVAEPEKGLMHVDLAFPHAGYRVAEKGQTAVAAGIRKDGTFYISNVTAGTRIEVYTGFAAQVVTHERLTYPITYGDATYFAFRISYKGNEVKIKDITLASPTAALSAF